MSRPRGRPKKPAGEGIPVRLDPALVVKARYVAANRGIALSEFLSELIRPALDREFRKEGKRLMDDID